MAVVAPSSPETLDSKPDKSELENLQSTSQSPSPLPPPSSTPSSTEIPNPNPTPAPTVITPPPPAVPSFAPSFRPLGAPAMPQYSTVPNPSYPMAQSPGIQPPGVSAPVPVMYPGAAGGVGSVPASVPQMRPIGVYQPPGSMPMQYGQVPNGYMAVPQPPGAIPPPGVPRYPGPYPAMFRPGFPPRPIPPMGVIPRPPIPGIRGIPPVVTPAVRPVIPIVPPAEKPQTTVYVGKIASTVDNEFLLSILRLCGPVKSWKRAQDPSDGTPKGFGFCEFESAEGVLRAMRLLSKLNIDGQELVLNINQATKDYLEKYIEKKTEREKLKGAETEAGDKENENGSVIEKESPKPVIVETKKDPEDSDDKEKQENAQKFGIVTDEDREADRDALEKITSMIEERLKTKPLPPPPPVQTPADGSAKSHSELPSKSRDGDSDVDIVRSDAAEDKNDDDTASDNKMTTENDKPDVSSPDRSRRSDRNKERDRDRDLKREKERELERYERERERERVRRERERELKLRESERLYKDRVKEWEAREREKDYQRQYEKEREKERERERRREILKQEDESDDDDSRKRRRRSSVLEDKKRKRQREKEDDLADRFKEEDEITEAKRRALEEPPQKDESKASMEMDMESEKPNIQEERKSVESNQVVSEQDYENVVANGDNVGDGIYKNNIDDELGLGSGPTSDVKQNSNAPTKKLGFGLIGSGKRTTVPSVFHQEDDEDVDDKKMRPLVPIDYSTEELQAVQSNASGAPPNIVAAAEFAKRISTSNPKEEKSETEKDRSRRYSDRSNQRDRARNDDDRLNQRDRGRNEDDVPRLKDDGKDKMHDKMHDREKDREDKPKADNKKLLDAKQLIDMIPKTKEELFVYEINWAIYDKHQLQERMRPWISKKITEFLGEEEATLVDYIVSCTKDHVQASKMLELLQSILDDEAEMFVLKMWRMLIFEIKKVETGLSVKPRV
ncbi:RNA-binding motif protein 25 isoform X1 [Typha latifolia]|uniref:RNA-binding motif protein 25 isoform X1 n=2 Tax=Typha latifolia TaxID=4733 RepID=UPI003C2DF8EC